MTSILTSTKKLAGMTEEYKAYDDQIIMYINSTLLRLKQIGVGPSEGFVVTGSSETWEQFIPYESFFVNRLRHTWAPRSECSSIRLLPLLR